LAWKAAKLLLGAELVLSTALVPTSPLPLPLPLLLPLLLPLPLLPLLLRRASKKAVVAFEVATTQPMPSFSISNTKVTGLPGAGVGAAGVGGGGVGGGGVGGSPEAI
jgi:hypothetical protein